MASGTKGLAAFSEELAGVMDRIAPSVVRVDDGTRLTATGMVWSTEGVIVATSHGVERDEELEVEMANGSRHAATLVGRDPDTDVAVLRIEATGLKAVDRAGQNDVRVGHIVLAVGRPGSIGLRATFGIVSARTETETGGEPGYILHTDADQYPGFSGGPLVDTTGRTVGMNNLMFGRGSGVAVGTPVVAQIVDALMTHGAIKRGYLGIRTQVVEMPESLRQANDLPSAGLLIVRVETGSPAEQAGLLLGDTLLQLAGQRITDTDDLRRQLRAHGAGGTVAVQLLRGGELKEVEVILGSAS